MKVQHKLTQSQTYINLSSPGGNILKIFTNGDIRSSLYYQYKIKAGGGVLIRLHYPLPHTSLVPYLKRTFQELMELLSYCIGLHSATVITEYWCTEQLKTSFVRRSTFEFGNKLSLPISLPHKIIWYGPFKRNIYYLG